MNRRVLVTIFLIFTTSVISCIELNSKYVGMIDSCEVEISHNSVKPCCCNENHNEFQISQLVEIPVIASSSLAVTHHSILYKVKEKHKEPAIVSTFFTPLLTIRLLI